MRMRSRPQHIASFSDLERSLGIATEITARATGLDTEGFSDLERSLGIATWMPPSAAMFASVSVTSNGR